MSNVQFLMSNIRHLRIGNFIGNWKLDIRNYYSYEVSSSAKHI